MKIARTILPLVAFGVAAPFAHAYVDVELDGGRHVIGQYYTDQGGKLTVFRPSGAIELDRKSIRSIQEPPGDMPSEVIGTVSDAPAATAASVASPGGHTVTESKAKDPEARERELGHQLVNMRLDRLAATQRGDNDAVKKLDKQINSLQGERQSNWKKLHSSDAEDSSNHSSD